MFHDDKVQLIRFSEFRMSSTYVLERLEDRHLLAAESVFASFEGEIDSPDGVHETSITLSPEDFALRGNNSLLALQVVRENGSGLNPSPVEVRNSNGDQLLPLYSNADLNGDAESLVLVELGHGSYTLGVGGENQTTGQFLLEVSLVGDVNGDHRADRDDAILIRGIFGTKVGDDDYLVAADANLDGRISSFDLFQGHRNSNDATNIGPLGLTLAASVDSDSIPLTGATVTDADAIVVVGTTNPSATVEWDTDGDGSFDG